jgi:glyoxalase/bleomycin resistance protein/dioxygenase superfamily protein
MAITGTHVLLYSSEPEKLRAVLRDVFGWKHVDAGQGWLIFKLPPSELGVHPAESEHGETPPHHQFTLMCDDIQATVKDLMAKGIRVEGEPQDRGWGIVVDLRLPGDLAVMLYQPRHPIATDL